MSARSRDIAAICLVVLGGVCTLLATLVLFANHNLVDRDGFAHNVATAVKKPAVSKEISVRLADAAVNAVPDLVAGERLLEDAARTVTASDAFEPIVHRAALILHDEAFSEQGPQLVLDLADGLQLLGSVLSAQVPELAAEIERDVEAEVISIRNQGWTKRITDASRTVEVLSWVLPVGTLVLFGAAVAVAGDRRRAFFRVGLGIAAAGAGLFIAELILRQALISRRFAEQEAVEQALDAFLDGLPFVALAIGAAGALIAAAASPRLDEASAERTLVAVWRWLRTPPGSTRGRAVRALLLGAGVLFVFEPRLALEIVAVAVGLLLLVEGLTEVVALLAATSPAPAAPAVVHKQASSRHIRGRNGRPGRDRSDHRPCCRANARRGLQAGAGLQRIRGAV